MPQITLFLGILLTVAGIAGYLGSGMESATALIPSFFGIVFMILGWLGYRENLRKHMMHAAILLALLGLLGSAMGVMPFLRFLGGAEIERPLASGMQSLMTLLCLIYMVLAVKSFIDARKKA